MLSRVLASFTQSREHYSLLPLASYLISEKDYSSYLTALWKDPGMDCPAHLCAQMSGHVTQGHTGEESKSKGNAILLEKQLGRYDPLPYLIL